MKKQQNDSYNEIQEYKYQLEILEQRNAKLNEIVVSKQHENSTLQVNFNFINVSNGFWTLKRSAEN